MKTLRRLILIVMALVVCAGSADAKLFRFGVKAGLNVNHLSLNKDFTNSLIDKSNRTGWEAGALAEVNIPVIGLGVDASLMYARMNNGSDDNVGKNFLMIPINLKYKLTLPVVGKYIAPYIFTGPDFAFKLDKNIKQSFETKTCQVAWNFGLGLELINHLQIGASYGLGINNIADKVTSLNTTNMKLKNNYWTVTAAWLF